ncbi:hypothetical protein [Dongia deserti]|uniref:hypothetical protein n=1 Tax=Dongia deserti TaxID=2268030 RepID=UPI000E64EB9A|nr:hypothetical protein [Dongia deserti]
MINTLRISVHEERDASAVVRTASYSSPAGSRRVFYHVSGDVLPPPLEVYDFAVVAAIYAAMREGIPVHVEGPVTAELLRNLEEFQEAWAMWRSTHRPVQITADQILPAQQSPSRRGVFAFSGGVDGTFALLRHHAGRAGLRTARPVCAMLVWGFDLPLDNQSAFDRAHGSISDMMGPLGIPLVTVRTNWRAHLSRDWLMEYHAALSACLLQFRGLANVGVCGAGEDYSQLAVPWGSNPVTNHLLSGGGFQLHTEGGGFTRTERVRLICDYPDVAAKLRVCWEGPKTGGNCGVCEKCIRTKLNFLANKQEPLCFDRRPTDMEILRLTARNQVQLAFLNEIMAAARKNGASGPWLSSLRLAIAKNRLMLPARTFGRRVAARMRPLLGRPVVIKAEQRAPQVQKK